MIEIDGSYGEGGGSIVRLAVAFSAVAGKPVRIINIRKKRQQAGLMAQHLTAVKAVAQLCDAEVKGMSLGSKELEFIPGAIKGGKYELDIGTAGSISLVLQALMIPAFHSEHETDIHIIGGTYVRKAPSVNYLKYITLPLLEKLGYEGEIQITKHGFFPKGNGKVYAAIHNSRLKSIELTERGELKEVRGYIVCSDNLKSRKVGERIKQSTEEAIISSLNLKPKIKLDYVNSLSPGCGVDLIAEYEHSLLGGSSVGELKKSAEEVGREAAEMLLNQHYSNASVDEHALDQILPYLALASGTSRLRIPAMTEHARTNIWLLEKFLERKFSVKNNLLTVD